MAVEATRSQYFYREGTLNANYIASNSWNLKTQAKNIRLAVSGGDMVYSLIGPDSSVEDGTIKDGENLFFPDLETSKIAVKGTGTYRVWAY